MIALPILPDTLRIPLDEAGYAGVVAVVRPLDNDALAAWVDAFPSEAARNAAAVACVRQQLVTVDGVTMRAADGTDVPYEHAAHFRSLPTKLIGVVYAKLIERAGLTGEQEKNSASPSDSDGTSGSVA